MDFKTMLEPEITDFVVEDIGDGVRIKWGQSPFESMVQSYKQASDLDDKLRKALGISE